MLLYGAGGHAKVIISCLQAWNIPATGIFDDDLSKVSLINTPVIGRYRPEHAPEQELIIAVGNNQIREKVASFIQHRLGKVIHPSVLVATGVSVGEGSVVFHNAILQTDTQIGKHVIINTAASVDHECIIEDFVHIAPGVTLCGNIRVGKGSLIGAGSVVTPNLIIGKNCLIAAGSVITKNLPDGAIVRGNPARIIKVASF
jgi:sugar O-acyltransferase (sialic acid O-acetyltransferase NeuD family)